MERLEKLLEFGQNASKIIWRRIGRNSQWPKTGNNLRHPVAATIGNQGRGGGSLRTIPSDV